jgi:hypothetical protein
MPRVGLEPTIPVFERAKTVYYYYYYYYYFVCEASGTAATPGLFIVPASGVIVKMIVEKQMECRLAGETEVLLGENLPQRHTFTPSGRTLWPWGRLSL